MPLTVLDIGWPQLGLGGIASGSVHYREPAARAAERDAESARPRPHPRRPGAVVEADRHRPQGACSTAARRRCARSRSAKAGPSAGRRRGSRRSARGPGSPSGSAARRCAPSSATRAGRHAVAAVRGRIVRPVRPGRDRRRYGGRLVDPQIRGSSGAQGARLESAVTGTVIENLDGGRPVRRVAAGARPISGGTPGGGAVGGRGTVDFAAAEASACDLDVRRRECAAARPRRYRRRRDRAARDPLGRRWRRDHGRRAARWRPVPRSAAQPRRRSAATQRARVNDGDEVDRPPQLAPWRLDLKVAAPQPADGHRPRHRQPLADRPRDRAEPSTEPRSPAKRTWCAATTNSPGAASASIRGTIRFRGESPPNPLLDIAAEAQVQGVDAPITVTGTSLQPEIAFTRARAAAGRIAVADAVRHLDHQPVGAGGGATGERGAASSPDGRPRPDQRGAARGRARPAAHPACRHRHRAEAPQFAAGKYIGRKSVRRGDHRRPGLFGDAVEYQITRWLSLLSWVSTIGRTAPTSACRRIIDGAAQRLPGPSTAAAAAQHRRRLGGQSRRMVRLVRLFGLRALFRAGLLSRRATRPRSC